MHKTIYRRESRSSFPDAFSRLARSRLTCSSLYSPENIRYREILSKDNASLFEDLSYVVINDSGPCFAFIGFYSVKNSHPTIACGDIPCAILESEHISKGLRKQLLLSLLELFKHYECRADIANAVVHSSSVIMEDLFLTRRQSVYFCARRQIYLDQSLDVLRSDFRKSFKPLISKGYKLFDLYVMHGPDSSLATFREFISLHKLAAGRTTRPIESWLAQYDSVIAKESFCVLAMKKGSSELVSAALFTMSFGHVYYAVSASRRDLYDLPLSHVIIYHALNFAKKHGCKVFEIDSFRLSSDSSQSDKEVAISHFKAGFGGSIVFSPQLALMD